MYVIISALGLGAYIYIYRCIFFGRGGDLDHSIVWLLPTSFDTVLVEQRLGKLSSPRLPANDFLHSGRFPFLKDRSCRDGPASCGTRRTRGWGGSCRLFALICAGLESGFLGRHFPGAVGGELGERNSSIPVGLWRRRRGGRGGGGGGGEFRECRWVGDIVRSGAKTQHALENLQPHPHQTPTPNTNTVNMPNKRRRAKNAPALE